MTAVLNLNWQPVSPERCLLGESPFWHPDEQQLYWVDIPGKAVFRCNVHMGTVQRWDMPSEPGSIAPARSGGLVLGLRDGVYRATEWGGEVQLLARFSHDPVTTRFNDGKCDPVGRFWVGTMYEPRTQRLGELFSLDVRNARQPEISLKAINNVISNGLAWSPDARTLYWADTMHHLIHAWDWDATSNAMRHHRTFAQLPLKPEGFRSDDMAAAEHYGGRPDGAAMDVEGNYWSAMFEGGRLVKFSPRGEILASVPVPARCPTMPCFGGDDGRTLYLTTASHGRPPVELERWPHNGLVLAARVDVPGVPVNFFEDR
jgi:sugar lactone lactonase YvrE